MALYSKYLNKTEFNSYEDFYVNFRIQVPDKFNFAYDVIDEIANAQPDKVAMVWCSIDDEDKIITFGELQKQVNKTANYLQSKGIHKGKSVMLILKRHYQYWYAILALHKLGAITIPATSLLTAKDVNYRVDKGDVDMIICTETSDVPKHVLDGVEMGTRPVMLSCTGQVDGFDNFNEEIEKFSNVFERPTGDMDAGNDDIMLLYFTSGTTGHPKMVAHDYTYPLGHIHTAKFWHHCEEDGLHLTVSETGWAKAAWGKIYGQWLCGSAIFVYDFDKFVPQKLLEKIKKYKITTFCAPPTVFRFFIKENMTKEDFASVKHVCIAGEPLNPEVFKQFKDITGLELREGFGQTECTLAMANYEWIDVCPGSMGKPSPTYNVDIIDEDGKSCKTGQTGQIIFRANRNGQIGLFKGYYKDDEKTEAAWEGGVFHTGDVAWRDEHGYYWYVGRADDVIKSSGYRIGPFEVESALLEHPSVLECAVTAAPDPVRGAVVKATITLARGYEPSDELKKELQEHVKNVTAPYKYPRIIEFTKELPKTISGKIRRVEIRAKDKQK